MNVQCHCRLFATIAFAGAMFATATAWSAGSEGEFYSGKTIQLLIGFSSGGGYDIYGRTLARYLGRHIPGHPQIVPQNMPGAGSLKLVNYLYNVAPKDGTSIGHFAPGVLVEPLLGHTEGAQFKALNFGWIGSISQEVSVCAYMTAAGIASWHDMQTKPAAIGASGGGAESDVFATLLRNLFHLPITHRHRLSGQRRDHPGDAEDEVDGHCGWSWTSLLSRNKAMLTSKEIDVTLQIALSKDNDPYLADVPLIMDMTVTIPR